MQRIAALLLLAGTAVAWFGESRPIIFDTFSDAPNPQQFIDADPGAWQLAMLAMAAGAVIAAIGILLLAVHIRRLSDDETVKRLSIVAGALAIISTLTYATSRTISATTRLWEPPINGTVAVVLSLTYGLGWQLALILAGYLLLRSDYPKWLAWPVMLIAGLLLVATAVTGGMPPGLYYFVVLFMGIVLLFVRTPQQEVSSGAQLEGSAA